MNLPDGFRYVRSFLTSAQHDALLADVRAMSYVHDRFRGQELKRASACCGFTYTAAGRKLHTAPPFPPFLRSVAEDALAYCPDTEIDQCISTRYGVGAGIGWHSDAKQFGGTIMGVSLAGSARLQFRPNGSQERTHELVVAPGSLYVMQGPARWDYQHRVLPVKTERYSLTFRQVIVQERG